MTQAPSKSGSKDKAAVKTPEDGKGTKTANSVESATLSADEMDFSKELDELFGDGASSDDPALAAAAMAESAAGKGAEDDPFDLTELDVDQNELVKDGLEDIVTLTDIDAGSPEEPKAVPEIVKAAAPAAPMVSDDDFNALLGMAAAAPEAPKAAPESAKAVAPAAPEVSKAAASAAPMVSDDDLNALLEMAAAAPETAKAVAPDAPEVSKAAASAAPAVSDDDLNALLEMAAAVPEAPKAAPETAKAVAPAASEEPPSVEETQAALGAASDSLSDMLNVPGELEEVLAEEDSNELRELFAAAERSSQADDFVNYSEEALHDMEINGTQGLNLLSGVMPSGPSIPAAATPMDSVLFSKPADSSAISGITQQAGSDQTGEIVRLSERLAKLEAVNSELRARLEFIERSVITHKEFEQGLKIDLQDYVRKEVTAAALKVIKEELADLASDIDDELNNP